MITMKIVIVEDDAMLAEIYQTSLQTEGFICHVAHDGVAALGVIQEQIPDLVLLDLMIPQISGDEVLHQMRESDWGKHIKVIIATNISESEAPDGLSKYGFERYLVKANTGPAELVQIIKQTLEPKQPDTAAVS
jgi:two-component system, OmpR family, alkaline phosphatase synthesis response regulator PhoP